MFQAPNGTGLGHVNRLTAIALAIRAREPDAILPFVLFGGGQSLLKTASLPYITLPHGSLLLKKEGYTDWGTAIVSGAARSIIHGWGPELIVFDTIPCLPFMATAAQMKVPMALCARSTKDTETYFDWVLEHESLLDLIIIPHEPGEIVVPDRLISRVRFVGNIVRLPAPTSNRASSGGRQLVITGGDGYPRTVDFYNLALEAYARYRRKDPHLECVLVAGPLFEEWWDLQVTDGVRVIPAEPQMRELMTAADLVICQGGYNTVSEVSQLGLPSICVPGMRDLDDQFARARETAKSAPHFQLYEGNDPDILSALIESCLAAPRPADRASPLLSDGANRAAAVLLEHAAQRKSALAARQHQTETPRSTAKIGRNDPCPCGSGKKYKNCHGRHA